MDKNQLVERVRARLDHSARRRQLKEKYQARMIFAHAEGMWRAGPELQMLLSACHSDQAVLLDLYENPVRVNVQELIKLNQNLWQEQMNAWLVEHQALADQR